MQPSAVQRGNRQNTDLLSWRKTPHSSEINGMSRDCVFPQLAHFYQPTRVNTGPSPLPSGFGTHWCQLASQQQQQRALPHTIGAHDTNWKETGSQRSSLSLETHAPHPTSPTTNSLRESMSMPKSRFLKRGFCPS